MIKQRCLWILLNVVTLINFSNEANIFCIFPMASFSHQQPMLALSRALAAKGHNLTVITTDPSKVPIKNHREIDMSFLYEEFRLMSEKIGLKVGYTDGVQFISSGPVIMEYFTPIILRSPQIQNLIREVNGTKYDLIIYEPMFLGFLIAFADIIGNPPIIGIQTFDPPFVILDEVSSPLIPSYIPDKYLPYDDRMTIWQRIYNLFIIGYSYFTHNYYTRPLFEAMVQKYFGKLKYSVKEIEYNKSLYIVTTDHSTEYPRPNQPNTIFVGPMHLSKVPKPLPMDLQKWMDEAEDGVIYFSLGGNMQSSALPDDVRNSFIKAFEQFPKMRILWKWEAETKLPGQPDNVLVNKWLPQQSILAHRKCKLFISQVGLQSFQEAIHFAIPMLGLPLFSDQHFNTRKLIVSGGGLGMEFHDVTHDLVYDKINQLLTNSSYKENMKRLAKISSDRPMSPIDTAIWWVEYVLRHNGAPHLRPASLDLDWYKVYMLDILLIVLISIVVILYVIYFISCKLLSCKKLKKLKTI